MRIVALGDSHFEEGPRFEECVRVHSWVADYIRREKPDAVLHGGDVYDKASTPLERLAAADFFRSVADVCSLTVAKGNHDRPRDLQLLASLQSRYSITVVEGADVVRAEGAAIAICAWPTRSSDLDEDGSRQALRNVLRGLGDELAPFTGPRVLLGHFLIDGSLTGAGQPLVGGGLGVSLADLALARAHVVLASHVHRAQEFDCNGVPVIYAGSSHRTDYGEAETKSIVSLEVSEDGYVTWERIPTPARPMLLVDGHYDPTELGIAVDLPPDTSVAQADMRLRYAVALEHRDYARKHAEELRSIWLAGGAASVKIESEITASTRARSIEVSKARTLAAKVQAHWIAKNDVPEPSRAARLLGRIEAMEAGGQ